MQIIDAICKHCGKPMRLLVGNLPYHKECWKEVKEQQYAAINAELQAIGQF